MKHLEKGKLFFMSKFFFSHSVFKRSALQTRKNQILKLIVEIVEIFLHHWKKRKCWLPAFSHFLTMFSKAVFLNPFSHKLMTPFDAPWETSLLKTLWEKEKLLVMSDFFFSDSVFYLGPARVAQW